MKKLAVKLEGGFSAVVEWRTKEVEISEGEEGVVVLTWGEVDQLAALVMKARSAPRRKGECGI
jgi:ABC-type enterochelin transport system substrate-binding protein